MRIFLTRPAWLLGFLLAYPAWGSEEGGVELRKLDEIGRVVRVHVEFRAEGDFTPLRIGSDEKIPAEHRRIESKLSDTRRTSAVDGQGLATAEIRKLTEGEVFIENKGRSQRVLIRPEVSFLSAWRSERGLIVTSPWGPLAREEVDLLESPGDPMAWIDLLPGRSVKSGESWPVGAYAARSLSGYDTLATNGLKCVLSSFDAKVAKIRLTGEVRGAWLGAEGVVKHEGALEYDRSLGRVTKLELKRSEVRAAGAVEDGLDVKSELRVRVEPAEAPAELGDDQLRKFATAPPSDRQLLIFADPGERYTFEYDRDWHIFWSDTRRSVLKRLFGGEVTAQLNLAPGSPLSKNGTPDAEQFREDVKRALGARFVRFADPGEFVDFKDGPGKMLRVVVEGRQGDEPIVWTYFLIVSPKGERFSAMYALRAPELKGFGDADLRMMGSIRWTKQ